MKRINFLIAILLLLSVSGCDLSQTSIITGSTQDEAGEITRNFYQDWIDGKYGYDDQSYRQIPIWDKKLTEKIEQIIQSNTTIGYDPVVCTQEKPTNFDVSLSNVSIDKAYVLVIAKSSKVQVPIDVTLRKDGNRWLMIDINCQKKTSESNPENEQMVREYLDKNISELSPVKEVLGGKFKVGDVSFVDNNSGLVTYDDGHILLSADFQYVIENDEVEITSFVVRPEENTQPK